jgi:hypothetical protein
MDKETKLATLVGLKSFIECFETTKWASVEDS